MTKMTKSILGGVLLLGLICLLAFTLLFFKVMSRNTTIEENGMIKANDERLIGTFMQMYFAEELPSPNKFTIHKLWDSNIGFFKVCNDNGEHLVIRKEFTLQSSSSDFAQRNDQTSEKDILDILGANNKMAPKWYVDELKTIKNFKYYSFGRFDIIYDLDRKTYLFQCQGNAASLRN